MQEVKFEKVSSYRSNDFNLPQRKTKLSAGYDFELPNSIVIPSHFKILMKMLFQRLSNEEFLTSLLKTEFVEEVVQLFPEDLEEMDVIEKTEVLMKWKKLFPTVTKEFGEHFTLSLEKIKNFTKETDTRATLVPTGVKAKLQENQKLELLIRSSTPFSSYLIMGNSVGLIDADYYDNEDNEGHIFFQVINLSPFDITLEKGDIIGQGVISTYDTTTNDEVENERKGGIGSTS